MQTESALVKDRFGVIGVSVEKTSIFFFAWYVYVSVYFLSSCIRYVSFYEYFELFSSIISFLAIHLKRSATACEFMQFRRCFHLISEEMKTGPTVGNVVLSKN